MFSENLGVLATFCTKQKTKQNKNNYKKAPELLTSKSLHSEYLLGISTLQENLKKSLIHSLLNLIPKNCLCCVILILTSLHHFNFLMSV